MVDTFSGIDQFLKDLVIGLGLPPAFVGVLLKFAAAAVLGTVSFSLAIFLIWVERKLVARIQDRLGPNRVGPFGLLQTIADAMKLLTQEVLIPDGADRLVFRLAPPAGVGPVGAGWAG